MFETLETLAAGWRAVAHISAWTGLSVGALAVIGVCVYIDPAARRAAILAAAGVVLGWACLVHGHAAGVSDRDAELKTISDQVDARAGDRAKQDEISRVNVIKAEAEAQHESDVAEIARLKDGGDGCSFDPGIDDGGLRPHAAVKPGAVHGNAKPAGIAKAPDKGAGGSALGRFLHLPLVWGGGVQGQRPAGDASPHGK